MYGSAAQVSIGLLPITLVSIQLNASCILLLISSPPIKKSKSSLKSGSSAIGIPLRHVFAIKLARSPGAPKILPANLVVLFPTIAAALVVAFTESPIIRGSGALGSAL